MYTVILPQMLRCFTFNQPFKNPPGFNYRASVVNDTLISQYIEIINLQIQIDIRLHAPWANTFFYVYVHNKNQMYFTSELFGNDNFFLDTSRVERRARATELLRGFKVKRTLWKSLDTPSKRCDKSNTDANTTKCITQYLEDTVGCSMGLARSDPGVER